VRGRQDPPARPARPAAPGPGGAVPGAQAHAGHRDDRGRGIVHRTNPRMWQIHLKAYGRVVEET
jgi:hypothetical protein